MLTESVTRRRLLLSSLLSSASAVRASSLTMSATALFAAVEQAYAAHDDHQGAASGFTTLSQEEALELGAMAARIIPTDDTPGATEAGAIHFIDKVLGSSRAELLTPLRSGLADLQGTVVSKYGSGPFSALTPEQQDAVLYDIETTPFFTVMRFLTIAGTFALPEYGGNRDHVGWNLVGFDHRHVWQPPFGYYDADYMSRGE